MDIDKLA